MQRKYTRQAFMLQVASGFAALAVGCGGDDDDETGTETDATTDPSGTSGSSGGSGGSSSGGGSETTDATDTTTGEPGTSSSSGGADTGSSSGEGSSSGSSSGGEASVCLEDVVVAVISMNHGHELQIPLADIEAGVETTYDATGTSGHCHEVILTAEDFATLRAGGTVIKYSCNGGDHEYAISCAKGGEQPGDPAKECAVDPGFGSC